MPFQMVFVHVWTTCPAKGVKLMLGTTRAKPQPVDSKTSRFLPAPHVASTVLSRLQILLRQTVSFATLLSHIQPVDPPIRQIRHPLGTGLIFCSCDACVANFGTEATQASQLR
jgi:hypothetical protein